MDELDIALSAYDDSSKARKVKKEITRTKKEIVRNIPQILSVIICVIVVMMTFADFTFERVMTPGFAAKSALFVILSYGIYYAQKTSGKRNGMQDKDYKQWRTDHKKKVEEVVKEMKDEYTLNDYCSEWAAWEAEKTKRAILSGTGVTDEEWKRFSILGKLAAKVSQRTKTLQKALKKEKISQKEYDMLLDLKELPGEKKYAIVRANLVAKQSLSPSDLIYETASRDSRDRTPQKLKSIDRRQDIFSLLPSTLMMAGILLIVPEIAATDISIKTILYGLMRVFSLLVMAFRGNMNGETIYTVEAIEIFKIQIHHLNLAMEWRSKHERTENGRDSSVETD